VRRAWGPAFYPNTSPDSDEPPGHSHSHSHSHSEGKQTDNRDRDGDRDSGRYNDRDGKGGTEQNLEAKHSSPSSSASSSSSSSSSASRIRGSCTSIGVDDALFSTACPILPSDRAEHGLHNPAGGALPSVNTLSNPLNSYNCTGNGNGGGRDRISSGEIRGRSKYRKEEEKAMYSAEETAQQGIEDAYADTRFSEYDFRRNAADRTRDREFERQKALNTPFLYPSQARTSLEADVALQLLREQVTHEQAVLELRAADSKIGVNGDGGRDGRYICLSLACVFNV
jgi:hypothetical protein